MEGPAVYGVPLCRDQEGLQGLQLTEKQGLRDQVRHNGQSRGSWLAWGSGNCCKRHACTASALTCRRWGTPTPWRCMEWARAARDPVHRVVLALAPRCAVAGLEKRQCCTSLRCPCQALDAASETPGLTRPENAGHGLVHMLMMLPPDVPQAPCATTSSAKLRGYPT